MEVAKLIPEGDGAPSVPAAVVDGRGMHPSSEVDFIIDRLDRVVGVSSRPGARSDQVEGIDCLMISFDEMSLGFEREIEKENPPVVL